MKLRKSNQKKGFGVQTKAGSIYSTNGEYYKPRFVGPGGYSAKVWKTLAGAQKFASRVGGTVIEIN